MRNLIWKFGVASIFVLGVYACSSDKEEEVVPEPESGLDSESTPAPESYPLAFSKIIVDDDAQGPAFSTKIRKTIKNLAQNARKCFQNEAKNQ